MNFKKEKFIDVEIDKSNEFEMSFQKCEFVACSVASFFDKIEDRFVIENIQFEDCKVNTIFSIGPVTFKNIYINGLKTSKPLFFENGFFENVKLKGKIGHLEFQHYARNSNPDSELNEVLIKENLRKYKDIPLALDISEAQFNCFECNSIPGEKIKINRINQFAIDYKKMSKLEVDDPELKVLLDRQKKVHGVLSSVFIYVIPEKDTLKIQKERLLNFWRENNCIIENHQGN